MDSLGVKNIRFIENTNLAGVQSYDLVISNFAFSEIGGVEQRQYLERVINPTQRGYMTMNFISQHLHSLTIDELIQIFYANNKKESVEKEYPNTNLDNLIITWKPTPPFASTNERNL